MGNRSIGAACAAVVVLFVSHQAAALQNDSQNCTTDANGNRVCTPATPEAPPTDLGHVIAWGDWLPPDPDPPFWLDAYNRYVYDSLFRNQTGPVEPGGQSDAGSPTEPTSNSTNNKQPCDNAGGINTKLGNPIDFSNGNKIEYEFDFNSAGEVPLFLQRTYYRYWSRKGLFGYSWTSNFDLSIVKSADSQIIYAYRDNATTEHYVYKTTPAVGWYAAGSTARILSDGAGGYIRYGADNSIERYNAGGQITKQTNSRGIGLTFTYSGTQLYRVTHTSGRYIQFVWTNGYVTSVTDPAGSVYQYGYVQKSPTVSMLSWSTAPGTPASTTNYHYENTDAALTGKSYNGIRYSTFTYDGYGRANSSVHSNGADKNSFVYAFPSAGQMTVEHTNPLGKKTTYRFQDGKLVSETGHASPNCPQAMYKEITYDANGYRNQVTDFADGIIDYDFSPTGLLLKKVEAAGTPAARTTQYVWDANNRATKTTILGVSETSTVYRTDGLVSSVTVKNLSPNGVANQQRTTTYAYTFHANGLLHTVTENGPLAGSADAVTRTYDATGNLVSVANGLGHKTTYSNFNGLGLPGRVVSPLGGIVDHTYDARGKVLTTTTYVGATPYKTTNTYDNRGRLIKVTTPEGVVTNMAYDNNNRLTKVSRANPRSAYASLGTNLVDFIQYTYNLNGDVKETVTGVTYTPSSMLTATASENELTATPLEYDGLIEPMACFPYPDCVPDDDPPPPTTSTLVVTRTFFDYDELGRLIAKRGNNGQNVRYAYDANGNISTVTDSLGKVTVLTYDALNRIKTSKDPLNGITTFEYNAADQVTKVTDAKGHATTYAYDGFGQLWKQVSPDTGTTQFAYDASGLLSQMTRNDGTSLSYVYDAIGRVTEIGDGTAVRNYTYDGCAPGALCGISAGTVGSARSWSAFTYTPYGQLSARRDGFFLGGADHWTRYTYDGLGRVTKIEYPSGVNVGYGYTAGLLNSITSTLNGVTSTVVNNLSYQPFGPAGGWSYGNGLNRTYNRDLDGRATGISVGTTSQVVQSLTFQLDAADQITKITNGVNASYTQTFGYDALSRLKTVAAGSSTATFSYDAVGNRTQRVDNGVTTTSSLDPASNRLNQTASPSLTRTFSINAVGNVYAYTGTDGVANTLSYDPFARVNSHTRSGVQTLYYYSALEERVGKVGGAAGTTRFVYGGGNLLAENAGTAWTSYIWLGGELVGLVRNNQLYFAHGDQVSRPEVVTNSARTPVWKAANAAFTRAVITDQISGLNIGFPGQYWDAESGLWHNGFRSYEATLGRYLQSDPVGLAGGVNTYAYVAGNPISRVDPLGLQDSASKYVYNSMTGSPNDQSLVSAVLHDGFMPYVEASLTGLKAGGCTLMCGADAVVGTSFESMAKNAGTASAFKGLDIGLKQAIKDVRDACMSVKVDKLAARAIARVTPAVNVGANTLMTYQFGSCVMRCDF